MIDTNKKERKVTTQTNKPTFEEWYASLSRPAKKAFRVGVIYALKMQKENATLQAILNS